MTKKLNEVKTSKSNTFEGISYYFAHAQDINWLDAQDKINKGLLHTFKTNMYNEGLKIWCGIVQRFDIFSP